MQYICIVLLSPLNYLSNFMHHTLLISKYWIMTLIANEKRPSNKESFWSLLIVCVRMLYPCSSIFYSSSLIVKGAYPHLVRYSSPHRGSLHAALLRNSKSLIQNKEVFLLKCGELKLMASTLEAECLCSLNQCEISKNKTKQKRKLSR